MKTTKLFVCAPRVPGALPTPRSAASLADARAIAATYSHRRDLTRQDVRIETATGKLIEYAGPCR